MSDLNEVRKENVELAAVLDPIKELKKQDVKTQARWSADIKRIDKEVEPLQAKFNNALAHYMQLHKKYYEQYGRLTREENKRRLRIYDLQKKIYEGYGAYKAKLEAQYRRDMNDYEAQKARIDREYETKMKSWNVSKAAFYRRIQRRQQAINDTFKKYEKEKLARISKSMEGEYADDYKYKVNYLQGVGKETWRPNGPKYHNFSFKTSQGNHTVQTSKINRVFTQRIVRGWGTNKLYVPKNPQQAEPSYIKENWSKMEPASKLYPLINGTNFWKGMGWDRRRKHMHKDFRLGCQYGGVNRHFGSAKYSLGKNRQLGESSPLSGAPFYGLPLCTDKTWVIGYPMGPWGMDNSTYNRQYTLHENWQGNLLYHWNIYYHCFYNDPSVKEGYFYGFFDDAALVYVNNYCVNTQSFCRWSGGGDTDTINKATVLQNATLPDSSRQLPVPGMRSSYRGPWQAMLPEDKKTYDGRKTTIPGKRITRIFDDIGGDGQSRSRSWKWMHMGGGWNSSWNRFPHLSKVPLVPGFNIITVYAVNTAGPAGFACKINRMDPRSFISQNPNMRDSVKSRKFTQAVSDYWGRKYEMYDIVSTNENWNCVRQGCISNLNNTVHFIPNQYQGSGEVYYPSTYRDSSRPWLPYFWNDLLYSLFKPKSDEKYRFYAMTNRDRRYIDVKQYEGVMKVANSGPNIKVKEDKYKPTDVKIRYIKFGFHPNSNYVKITQPYLQISQVAVYPVDNYLSNMAVNKKVTASPPFKNAGKPLPIARNAVDGKLDIKYYPNIYHSDGLDLNGNLSTSSWKYQHFTLDLGEATMIYKIVYYNRRGCCQTRSKDMFIQLLDNDKNIIYSGPPFLSESPVQEFYFNKPAFLQQSFDDKKPTKPLYPKSPSLLMQPTSPPECPEYFNKGYDDEGNAEGVPQLNLLNQIHKQGNYLIELNMQLQEVFSKYTKSNAGQYYEIDYLARRKTMLNQFSNLIDAREMIDTEVDGYMVEVENHENEEKALLLDRFTQQTYFIIAGLVFLFLMIYVIAPNYLDYSTQIISWTVILFTTALLLQLAGTNATLYLVAILMVCYLTYYLILKSGFRLTKGKTTGTGSSISTAVEGSS
tara:strand:- start:10603 stop:13887 length:3285 start_codon:yes stop_codon:yes gene_type:complete